MNEDRAAVDNAITFECKKDGLQQRQSGDWVLRVILQAIEMDERIMKAAMGTRFQCVLVEIGDDEQAIDHRLEERDKWRDLGPVRQAGIRCKDPLFQAFLSEEEGFPVTDEESAAAAVRTYCMVLTRTDLGAPGNDGKFLWLDLDNKYQAWKARENA